MYGNQYEGEQNHTAVSLGGGLSVYMLCPPYNVDRELRQAEGRTLNETCSTRS